MKDIFFAWRRWIASVAVASTLMLTGCATHGRRISWNSWGENRSAVVDSMKKATSRFAEIARLKKKETSLDEENMTGRPKVDKLRLQDEKKTTQKRSLGKTFAALIRNHPGKQVDPVDPFLAERMDQEKQKHSEDISSQQSGNRVVSAEKPVRKSSVEKSSVEISPFEQQKERFADTDFNRSKIDRLRDEIEKDQNSQSIQPVGADREALYHSQVKYFLSSARLLMKTGQRKQALEAAMNAKEISEKQSLFYGPNGDDPRALVRQIREEIDSSKWSASQFVPRIEEVEPINPFLLDQLDQEKNVVKNVRDKMVHNPFNTSKDAAPVKSFAPATDMIIESLSVPSRKQVRAEHWNQQKKKRGEINVSSELVAPDISITPKNPFQNPTTEQPVFKLKPQADLASTLSENPFAKIEPSTSSDSTGGAQMPVLSVLATNTNQTKQLPLAPPPPERLTDADFINEKGKAVSGPSFLFSGDQIAANEQQAAQWNASSQTSLPPMPIADSNAPELDGAVFSSWMSPKMIGIAIVLLLLLGVVTLKKNAPTSQEVN